MGLFIKLPEYDCITKNYKYLPYRVLEFYYLSRVFVINPATVH